MSKNENRVPYDQALAIANRVTDYLFVQNVFCQVAGSIARKRATIGDIDLVVKSEEHEQIQKAMQDCPFFTELIWTKGTKKDPSKIVGAFLDGIKIELYVAKPNALGGMILFANGSGMFNVQMRRQAMTLGYKLSQYGLFAPDGTLVASDTEEEIFARLNMKWIPPTERERG